MAETTSTEAPKSSENMATSGEVVYTSVSRFEDLNLHPEMGFKTPSKIQCVTLPMNNLRTKTENATTENGKSLQNAAAISHATSLPYRRGDKVEVRHDVNSFHGAWFEATVTLAIRKTRLYKIVYESLISEDNIPLAEIVSWDKIRPRPSSRVYGSDSQPFKLGQEVEACHNDGWWAGNVSKVVGEGRWSISFPCSGEVVEFGKDEVRIRHDWNGRNWVSPTTSTASVNDSVEPISMRENNAEVKDFNSVEETSEGGLMEKEILLSKLFSKKLNCKRPKKVHVEIDAEGEAERVDQTCSVVLSLGACNDFEQSKQKHKKQKTKRKKNSFSLLTCRSKRKISANFDSNGSNTKPGSHEDSDRELTEEIITESRSDRHVSYQSIQVANVVNKAMLGQSKEKQMNGIELTRRNELLDAAKDIDCGNDNVCLDVDVNNNQESGIELTRRNKLLDAAKEIDRGNGNVCLDVDVNNNQESENCLGALLISSQLSEIARNSMDPMFPKLSCKSMDLKDGMEFIEEVKLPFKKTSPVWESLESMKLYGTYLKQPHFSPLEQYREDFREGLAISMMINFDKMVKSIYQLGTCDPLSTFDQKKKDLLYFESHGFDVCGVRDFLKSLLLIRDEKLKKIAILQGQISDKQKELAELNRKKEALDKSLHDLSRDLTALNEMQDSLVLLAEKSRSEIFKLQEVTGVSVGQTCAPKS